jgi:DDE superfamily endonuclease
MLVTDAGRPVFLIVDNSQVHRARILKAHAKQSKDMLTLFFLPPYSPDLNPDEWVWKNVKHDNLGRASVKSESELAQFASTALAKLKEMPEKLRCFFGDPALRYIRDLATGVQKHIFALDHGKYAVRVAVGSGDRSCVRADRTCCGHSLACWTHYPLITVYIQ